MCTGMPSPSLSEGNQEQGQAFLCQWAKGSDRGKPRLLGGRGEVPSTAGAGKSLQEAHTCVCAPGWCAAQVLREGLLRELLPEWQLSSALNPHKSTRWPPVTPRPP